MRRAWWLCLLVLFSCRVERVTPGQGQACAQGDEPEGELWVYTSMYRHVVDALEPVIKQQLPKVQVKWFQAGSEKVMARLEAELAAGGTQADVVLTSDPFFYERFKHENRWRKYVSPNAVRTPRTLLDPDGAFGAVRLSTMVLVHRTGTTAPASFAALADPKLAGQVVIGDALTSGTAYTWAVFTEGTQGEGWFPALRKNGVRVAGGNAAVLQKVQSGEAQVGVVLLENALKAKADGSPIEIAWPSDGAVVIPGDAAILASTKHRRAAEAFIDALLSPEGQAVIVRLGLMHGVDPRAEGPSGEVTVEPLLEKSQPWSEAKRAGGEAHGDDVKRRFREAFSQ